MQISKNVSAETFLQPYSPSTQLSAHSTLESDACQFPLVTTTVRRMACDASLVTVLEEGAGSALNVGRKTRTHCSTRHSSRADLA